MLTFFKQKWYWVLGAVVGLWLVYRLMSHPASTGATATGSDPYLAYSTPQVITSTQQTDAALQVAQIQANSSVATNQIAAALAVQQATMAEHATESTNGANVQIAAIQGQQALAITNSNNAASMHISDNGTLLGIRQAEDATALGINQSNNGLTATESNNSLQWHLGDLASNLALVQSGNDLSATRDTNATQLAETIDTNKSKLAAYGIQAGVVGQQVAATQQVADAQIAAGKAVQLGTVQAIQQTQAEAIAAQSHQSDVARDLLNSGKIDLNHGTSVTEQGNIDALLAILNPSAVSSVAGAAGGQAYANAYGAGASTPNWASIAKSLTDGLTTGLKTLF